MTEKKNQGPTKTASCRSCGADIVWLKTNTDKWMPTNPLGVEKGDTIFDGTRMTSHYAECPHASEWRGKNGAEKR